MIWQDGAEHLGSAGVAATKFGPTNKETIRLVMV